MVHERCARPALQGRGVHGRHRSRRRSVSPAVDDPRADGRARRQVAARACPCSGTPRAAATARRCGTTCACPRRTSSARKAAASRSRRPASGPAASITACAPSASPNVRSSLMCMRAQMRVAFGQPLADQGVVRERIAESRHADRTGAAPHAEGGVDDGHGRQEAGAHRDRGDQGGRRSLRDRGDRPRHPVVRRRRRHRRLAARVDVRARAHAAPRRRTRRGAHAPDRPQRARQVRRTSGPKASDGTS